MLDPVALYAQLYDHVLARIDAERAHHLAVEGLRAVERVPGALALLGRATQVVDARLAQHVVGLPFANPLGVAAGLDKDGQAYPALLSLGFGHVEVGTVTPRPQPGNARPRVWRLTEQRALINALGFPSIGGEALRHRLLRPRPAGVLGVNLGKNKDTPLAEAAADYCQLLPLFSDVADYFVINVSSPNTPGLRQLQLAADLRALVAAAVDVNRQAARAQQIAPRPIFVKVAPDFEEGELEAVVSAAVEGGAEGIVASNTTVDRAGLALADAEHPGGLSGVPLAGRARRAIARAYRTVGDRVPIIGVGGVANAADVLAHLRAGARLVQLYTGFVYGGPLLPRAILRGLCAAADREGWRHIDELVGLDAERPLDA